jgi:hypothetical protein
MILLIKFDKNQNAEGSYGNNGIQMRSISNAVIKMPFQTDIIRLNCKIRGSNL